MPNPDSTYQTQPGDFREKLDFLQKVADLSPNILFVIDLKEQKVTYINNRVKKLLGLNAEEVYEQGAYIFKALIHPEDYELRMENLEKCKELPNEEEIEVEVRLQRDNKEWQWFKIIDKVFEREENGTVSQIIGTAQNIHHQKIFQERLKEEHRKFKNAQAIGHIGSFERKLPGDLVTYSEEFYHILGLDPKEDELSLEEFMSHVHPEDRKSYQAAIDHTHATGKPLDLITRLIRPDGSIRHVHRRAAILKDEKGTPTRVYGTVQDITERIEAEKERKKSEKLQASQIKESRALLKSVFDASPNSIVLYKTIYKDNGRAEDFEFVMVNSFTFNTTGQNTNIIGKRFSDVFPTSVQTGVLDQFKRTAETGVPGDCETWYDGEGMSHWFHIRTSKINDYLLATIEDITNRKKTEETLKQMFNGSFSAITMLDSIRDEEGKIIDFVLRGGNKAAEQILGISTEELVGKRLLELWPGVKDVLFDKYVEVVEEGNLLRTQHLYRHEDFDNWFDISAAKNGDGFIMTYHDISEQKKVEQELIQLKDELAQKATDKYSKIINAMDEGFCLLEIIRDDTGKCVNYRYLEINPVFEAQTGLKNAIGRTINELVPNIEDTWKEIYGNVALTGESIRFEDYAEGMNRWFDVNAFRIDAPNEEHVAVMFKDITGRKEAEERQTFLLKVADFLGPLLDPQEIIAEATRLVGQHFNADRANYYEIDENGWATMSKGFSRDGNSIPQKFPVSNFGKLWLQAFQNGNSLAVGNIAADNRFSREDKKAWKENGLSGGVGVPLVKEGRLIAVLGLNNIKPRSWQEGEIKLLQEVAERTWATVERAKVEKELKGNEERILQAMEAGNQFGWEVDLETGNVTYSGDQHAVLGFEMPNSITERFSLIHPNDLHIFREAYRKSLEHHSPLSLDQRLFIPGAGGKTVWTRLEGKFFGNPPKFIGTTRNINEEKKAEERQAYLLQLSDELRAVDDPEEIQYKAASILGEYLGAARVGYAEDLGDGKTLAVRLNYTNGVRGIEGTYTYEDYGLNLLKELQRGRTVVRGDIANNFNLSKKEKETPAVLDLAATVNVPFVRKEKLLAIMFIHFRETHHFSEQEVALLEETAERTWAAVERARAEKALREAQESLNIALEAAQMGTWVLDWTNKTSKRNLRHDQIFGYQTPQSAWNVEIAKKHVLEEDHTLFDTAFSNALKTGKLELEVRVRWQDGSIHWMAVNGHFYFDKNGKPLRAAGVNFEVTERRQAEQALRESEQRFRNLVEASALAVWETDPEGFVVKDSPSWREFTGQTAEEWMGQGWMNAIHPEDRKTTGEIWKKAVVSRQNCNYESRIRSAAGDYRWTNIKAIPIFDPEGRVTKWSGMNLDIHDRKLVEEALIKAKEEAEAASRAKEDFVSTMSHEIRTPLNAVIGLTNLLLDQNPRKDQIENLNSLSFSANNLLALINDILDFSKLEAGKTELAENEFNLPDLMTSLKQAHQPQAEANGTSLQLELGKTIPQRISTDQLKLSQILHNLVSNAVKFTNEGEVQIAVELNDRKEDQLWLDFSIRDTGIGIAESKVEHIFDKFAQAESSTVRHYGGTGLGLTITKMLLELMGSEIHLESKEGVGSKFFFRLPVMLAHSSFPPASLQERPEEVKDLKNTRVLLVEDVEINRKIIIQFLQNWWQLQPDEAVNGNKAVKMAKTNRYDLILMDVRMPEMDGYEATRQIRKLPGYKNIPILALTADKNLQIQQDTNTTQFSDLLTKPFEPYNLKQRILKHLLGPENSFSENDAADTSETKNGTKKELTKNKATAASFDISRFKKIAGNSTEILQKLITNSLRAFKKYKQEFTEAALEDNPESLSNLVHKNTTSVHYIQASKLAEHIERYRNLLQTATLDKESITQAREDVLLEFDNILRGLQALKEKK